MPPTPPPIQYDVSSSPGGSGRAAYEGTPGPAQAAQAGEYTKNPGLRKINWVLSNFKPPPIRQFN